MPQADSTKSLSRRDFLRYAAATGVALSVAGIPARVVDAAFVGELPPTREFDVIVIGTGMAGLAAAVQAGEQGARVAILEKQLKPLFGGNSRLAGGIFAAPEARTAEAKAQFIEDFLVKGDYRTDADLIETLADNILDDIEWLKSHGVEFLEPSPMAPYRVLGYTAAPASYQGMPKLLDTMLKAAENLGAETFFQTKAQELLVDASGNVVGVRAKTSKGLVDFRAKATVIATGGFAGNGQMLEQWVGPDADESMVRGIKWATGDGHIMAANVGAQLIQMGGVDTLHIAAVHPKNTASANPFQVVPYALGINRLGRRYVDESLGYVAHGKAAMNQPGLQVALVFDQAVADMPEGQAVISNFDRLGIEIIKANTLDELAAKIDVPADALKETVTSFNAAVQNGQALAADPPKAAHAVRIEKPPFYALYPLGPGITLTFGGIRINLRRQALDADGKPIGGLYAAGECVGGYFLGDYVGGGSLTRCLVDGRIAGRNAARA